MHSPIIIGHEPDFDFFDYEDDWEDSADEFYDEISSLHGKRKRGLDQDAKRAKKKRRELGSNSAIPLLKLDDSASVCSPVVWMPLSQRLQRPSLPIHRHNGAQAVALLKDWRDQLAVPPRSQRPSENAKQDLIRAGTKSNRKAVSRSPRPTVAPKKKAAKRGTAAKEQAGPMVDDKVSTPQKEPTMSLRKVQSRSASAVKETHSSAALADGQGNANRRVQPRGKRKAASGVEEEQPKKKTLTAGNADEVVKRPLATGRQTRSKKA